MSGMTMTTVAHPDADLLAACARFEGLDAEYRRSPSEEAPPDGYHEAAETISALRATTPEGKRAKAHAVWAFYQPTPPNEDLSGALWSLLCDVAEVTL